MLKGVLMPHPPIIIPEVGGRRRFEAKKTIKACQDIAEAFVSSKPDLIVAMGPHGPLDWNKIRFDKSKKFTGDLSKFSAPKTNFRVEGESKLVNDLITAVNELNKENQNKFPVEVLAEGRLDHGIMVPLYYLNNAGLSADIPWLIINISFWDSQSLFEFGDFISQYILEKYDNPKVLISGDLSHKIDKNSPAGYSPKGAEFDRQIIEDLRNEKIDKILNYDENFLEAAGECAYKPLSLGLGILNYSDYNIKVKSYEAPYGVGYGVAEFYN
ncbi:MAG: hypothetical protein ACQEQG_09215 [Bacillota bacterium]